MRTPLLIISAIAGLLASQNSFGQDPEFSQFYATNMLLNPAFTGSVASQKVELAHRQQWNTVNEAYQTSFVSYQYTSKVHCSGFGGFILYDQSANGALNTSNVALQYAHGVKINRKLRLRMGYEAAWVQKDVAWEKLSFSDMIDPSRGFIYSSQQPQSPPVRFVDFSSGALLYTDKFYLGGSIDHLTRPYDDFLSSGNRLARKYSVQGGMSFAKVQPGNIKVTFSPNLIYTVQGIHRQVNCGFYVTRQKITLGAWYRYKDAAIVLIGIETRHQKIGYSYDLSVNKLQLSGAGSHELTFQWLIPGKYKRTRYKTIDCPSF